VLSRALKQAVRLGLIARNPCDMVDPPRYEKSAPETLTDKDVNKVLESVRGTYLYIPVLIALATGASEVRYLDSDGQMLTWKAARSLYARTCSE